MPPVQLWLPGLRSCGYEDPWEGRNPRDLTRVTVEGIFKAQAEKSVSDFVSVDQYEICEACRMEGPPVYGGAPLLIPSGRG